MKKILFVFGTRPEAIKMAPVIARFKKDTAHFKTYVCVTAQHRQQLDSVLRLFGIKPDFDLNLMRRNQHLPEITCRILKGVSALLQKLQPDWVLVQGDTTTTFAAALAAFYQHIPVGHIEAGLRTYRADSPYPEEINRQLTSRLAALHFAPTKLNKENLLKESVPADTVFVTGNTVMDALQLIVKKISPAQEKKIARQLRLAQYDISRLTPTRKLILITCHRRENFGPGIEQVARAAIQLSKAYTQVDFVWPVHFNPNVRKAIKNIKGVSKIPNLFLIEPLDYLLFVYLMKKAFLILTDSGGVQEEAPALGTPVLVMREVTERTEALSAGCVKLIGTDFQTIVRETGKLLAQPKLYAKMKKAVCPYGDGKAGRRILEVLKKGGK
ncbi:MAG: UDP-N-acetylglucosamine 2-epimerase (non-hydrolyzing) [Elusimicrobiaceae bacterium]|nr:UDP-N-acetylglucosamine 2-epimerase (non-hydrolyzing) [Elusimicrobiaceae bacterium]